MHGKLACIFAAAISLGVTQLASAADFPQKGPAYSRPADTLPSWNGYYVGLNAGYGWGGSSVDLTGDPAALFIYQLNGVPTTLATSPKGFLAGAQAGYNWQRGKLVYGLEADIDYAAIKSNSSVTSPVPFSNFNITVSAQQSMDFFGTLRGRIGYTLWDPLLIYGTGGLATGHTKLRYDFAQGQSSGDAAKWKVGWTLGAGVEYAMSGNWTLKVEYLYYDLGKSTNTVDLIGAGAQATFEAAFKGSLARLGMNYRF
jgi:outer membrane immunogenic protein